MTQKLSKAMKTMKVTIDDGDDEIYADANANSAKNQVQLAP